jgi:hypothetical protein
MINLAASSHGMLSHDPLQHQEHLAATDPPAFDQTDHHPHILDYGCGRFACPNLGGGSWRFASRRTTGLTLGVQIALLFLVLRLAPVSDAPLGGPLAAMGLSTAEGTAQVFATGVAGMSEKKDAAMPAPCQASSQKRLGSQNRSQEQIVSED